PWRNKNFWSFLVGENQHGDTIFLRDRLAQTIQVKIPSSTSQLVRFISLKRVQLCTTSFTPLDLTFKHPFRSRRNNLGHLLLIKLKSWSSTQVPHARKVSNSGSSKSSASRLLMPVHPLISKD